MVSEVILLIRLYLRDFVLKNWPHELRPNFFLFRLIDNNLVNLKGVTVEGSNRAAK